MIDNVKELLKTVEHSIEYCKNHAGCQDTDRGCPWEAFATNYHIDKGCYCPWGMIEERVATARVPANLQTAVDIYTKTIHIQRVIKALNTDAWFAFAIDCYVEGGHIDPLYVDLLRVAGVC